MFLRDVLTKQFGWVTKPFSASAQTAGNNAKVSNCQQTAHAARIETETLMMRVTSFLLTLAFILGGPSMADPSDSNLPGVGTFSWNGSAASAVIAAN
jgi:hypothetical protein